MTTVGGLETWGLRAGPGARLVGILSAKFSCSFCWLELTGGGGAVCLGLVCGPGLPETGPGLFSTPLFGRKTSTHLAPDRRWHTRRSSRERCRYSRCRGGRQTSRWTSCWHTARSEAGLAPLGRRSGSPPPRTGSSSGPGWSWRVAQDWPQNSPENWLQA